MSDQLVTFKAYLRNHAANTGFRQCDLRECRGIDDFLEASIGEDWGAKDFAAQFLDRCCHADEPADHVLCMVALDFLDAMLGNRPAENERRQRLRDCAKIVLDPGTLAETRKWIDLWY